jgi:Domain of unknown function (DUF4292)
MNIAGNVFLKWSFGLLLIVLVGIGTTSCHSTKKISNAISKKDTLQKKTDTATAEDLHADSIRYIQQLYTHIQANIINCHTFSAKLKVHYEGSDGKNSTVNVFIRLQKDKMIWITIPGLIGEAIRAVITPDSVKVINKMEKVYQLRSVSYLQNLTHLPFDFNTFQSIILGNPVFLDSNIIYYLKDVQGISILSIGRDFRNYMTLNNSDLTIKHSKLDDVDQMKARSYDITYGDYERVDTVLFSTYRKISGVEKSRLDVEIEFKNIHFNDNLDFPFSIPKNYNRN